MADDGTDNRPKPKEKRRCPRCGGEAAPRRPTTRANPFLPKVKHLTCIDCGLDYTEDGKVFRP